MSLEVKNLKKSFGTKEKPVDVLKGLDLKVEDGEICLLLGPSGSGKSTLLNIVGGIDTPDSGQIIIDGKDLKKMNDKNLTRYRRDHLGYVFQLYNLIPNLTVRENIEAGAYLGKKPFDLDEMIRVLGLGEEENKLPRQISGGQQQRTAIGRAVIKNPDLLLCDEPTGALDYQNSKEILELLERINREYGTTILLVSHNEAFRPFADKVIELHDGQVRSVTVNENKLSAKEIEW